MGGPFRPTPGGGPVDARVNAPTGPHHIPDVRPSRLAPQGHVRKGTIPVSVQVRGSNWN